jgi:PAS domain S-box-containing protein
MISATEPDGPPLRVLLVEDDADDVLLCRDAIDHSDLRCQLSLTGTLQAAVERLTGEGADVALVDLSLPDAEDLQAVTALAQHFTDLPIVVLTGLRDELTAARALHAGAEDYLVKGAGSRDSIGRAIRYAIERKRGEQTRRAKDAAEAAKLRAEQSARELERNYRQLFDCSPFPMVVFNTGTLAFLEVNDAATTYYGYPREEFLAHDITWLCPTDDIARLTGVVATAATVERWAPVRQVKHDGSEVAVSITSHLLSFDGRDARCMVIEDITEREHLEGRLRQSQRLESLGQLAGGVAHDFNNLLGIILGYATMCAQDVGLAAQSDPSWLTVHNDLSQIIQAGDRASTLTRQLLSFARAEVAQTCVLDLNVVVTGIEQLLRRTIGEDIQLDIQLTGDPWPIRADTGQIEQVLLNLVVNARDAMPTGGVLGIITDPITIDEQYAAHHPGSRLGRYMRLRVTDTGTGMSRATIDRAFDPFFTTKPKGQGTGLGLATIYGIVTQSGGHVQIDSEPGAGTTVTTLLPVTDEATGPVEPAAPHSFDARDEARHHETVLIAEDETSLRTLTERVLTRHGYTVITASDGPDAVDIAQRHAGAIDLLLTDVIMPEMSGPDLARRLQATRPGLPVIYMSGYAEPLIGSRTALPVDVTVLSKPVTEREILEAIRRTLDAPERFPQP